VTAYVFVSTDVDRDETVLPFAGTSFSVGSTPGCEVTLPAGAPADLAARVDVLPGGDVRVKAVSGPLSVDGVVTSLSLIKPGQVVRLGPVGLLLRAAAPEAQKAPSTAAQDEVAHTQTMKWSMLAPGTLVAGRYEVVGRLASGAMGDVYRVEHATLRKPLALKVLKLELSRDPQFVERFQREAIATTRIGQQNIIEVFDFGQLPDGPFYFVMEYLDGETLAALVHQHGGMPVHRVLKLGLQVARALAASHEQGVVHRDVKPDNIMVLERPGDPDFVKVLDFGIAKVTDERTAGNQTAVGVIMGTPQYMAPEQCVGQPADARTDIYALGLILHELCTGRTVFQGRDVTTLMFEHLRTPAPRLGAGPLGDVPPDLDALVAMMLEKRSVDRPATMRQVIETMTDIEFLLERPRRPGLRDEEPTLPLLRNPVTALPLPATDDLPSRTSATVGGPRSGLTAPVRAPTVSSPAVASPAASPAGSSPAGSSPAGSSPAGSSPAGSEPDGEPEFTVTRSRAPLLVLGGVGVLLVVGVLAVVLGGSPTGKAVSPTPKVVEAATPGSADASAPPDRALPVLEPVAAPAMFTWHLTSRPAGALITIDGEALGKAPLDWTGAAGRPHELKATLDGYGALSMPLVATDAGALELVLKKAGGKRSDLKDPFAAPEAEDLRDPFGETP
jgi:eukaryotic-like serine/threonine-protein kinase